MRRYEYLTVDVFTDRQFGGNPLAVFPDAAGLTSAEMQSLSAEMNLSETSFVLPPETPSAAARVRIFNRTSEMPFAGHPNVGTAVVLAQLGRADGPVLRFEEMAGLVEVELQRDAAGVANGASIVAPRTLETFGELSPAAIAECLGLEVADLVLTSHPPTIAGVGIDFVLVEVTPAALGRASPRLDAYRRAYAASGLSSDRLSIFLYARSGDDVRARMFAPMAGTWEDPATGSANAALAALLLRIGGGDEIAFETLQGVEMGRPSRLSVRAWRTGDGIRAGVGGTCVPVFRGHVDLTTP
ncbi:trans-2,3-dihydro-3-hydroxyanthranilate isomerase [Sphingomonas sp. UYAg733]